MAQNQNSKNFIGEFINAQVISRGLDERTFKAYQKDLELFYLWLESGCFAVSSSAENGIEEKMETYLKYLFREKGLRASTIRRKQRVLGYYLSYLARQGKIKEYRPLKTVSQVLVDRKVIQESEIQAAGWGANVQRAENHEMDSDQAERKDAGFSAENGNSNILTKKEVDIFFEAISREYEDLDSDFRRRICLRDQVMMKLLFYHGIEISELLRMEVTDYNQKTAVLTVHRKKDKKREVYLFSKALQGQMAQWLEEHEYFERDEMYKNQIFLSKLGKPLSMKMVINIFDKYREMAGIEKVCKPKDLKNSLGQYAQEMMMELG